MRLIAEMSDLQSAGATVLDPIAFLQLLEAHGIRFEMQKTTDANGESIIQIWVHDEDEVKPAIALYKAFREHPEKYPRVASPIVTQTSEPDPGSVSSNRLHRNPFFSFKGPLSILIVMAAIALFIWAQFHRKKIEPPRIPTVIDAPVMANLEKKLLYDYPHYFVLRDQLLSLYPQGLPTNKTPSDEALHLIAEMKETPFWNGIYERLVNTIKKSTPLKYEGPLFEKIGQGQVWRLFTPVLVHFDIIHIFFNLLWFVILANQIEFRIGSIRLLLFMLLVAIVSNTVQYLMSGSFFMGLSGIVCGMAAFIWARQTIAPWEGYLLNRITLIFLLFFVGGVFALQLVFFFLEISSKVKFHLPIANSAHLVGGILGYLLGRLKFFSLKTRRL